jgi:hypothetical protein
MTLSNLLKNLLLLILGLIAGFYFLTYEKEEKIFTRAPAVCEEPLTYQIGTIDSQFDITRKDVEIAMQTASALWSDALERPVTMMAEGTGITVNFIYDERQELVDGELRFRERIESEQFRMNQLQQQYDRNRDTFDSRSADYLLLADRAKTELNELNSWVSQKNEEGGFTEQDVARFEERKERVESMQQRVIREREVLDRLAAQLNREAEQLNQKIDENNQLVDRYNSEFSGENRFTKASYQNSADGGMITVNMFLSKHELVLILAHELGHAFGLDHVSNPKSVMYGMMGAQELFPVIQLTREDMQAIRNLCN